VFRDAAALAGTAPPPASAAPRQISSEATPACGLRYLATNLVVEANDPAALEFAAEQAVVQEAVRVVGGFLDQAKTVAAAEVDSLSAEEHHSSGNYYCWSQYLRLGTCVVDKMFWNAPAVVMIAVGGLR
jgi:hypothetical protein